MAKTVVALMHDIDEAQSVVHDLVASGIQRENIGFRGNEGHALPSTAALNESEGSVEDVSSHGFHRSFRNTRPPFITNLTRCISVTSASGLPWTAIRSANLPFSTLPTCCSQ